ncbi:DUF5687 family protein [Petrimonas sp.]|uniref:DUF5687 family protein n=1 Tax=Petrimonas sp. TaxID=2023866 RepID=UPI003F517796
MYPQFFKHHWLKSLRAPGYYKNLIVNIFMGLSVLYFLVIFVLMGFMLPKILAETAPQLDPAHTFNGAMIFIIVLALLIRFLFQPLSTINLQSYQVLPIKRSKLVNYLLLKPLLNPANYLTLSFAIPFAITGINPAYGIGGAFRFILIVIFLIWFNTLFASFLKRKFGSNILGILTFLIIVAGLAALEYFKIFSVFDLSQQLFGFFVENPLGWLMVLAVSGIAFVLNKWFFAQNYYPENFDKSAKKRQVEAQRFTFMERFGKIGEIISLEMKLVLRHKRTKNVLYMVPLFLFYGLLFYPNGMYRENDAMLMFVAIFITGVGMIMFGQWIINWEGSYFDFLMTRNIDTQSYIRANYFLLLALSVVSYILTTPYFLFGTDILINHSVAFLYNVGVNIHVYLFGATYNTKRLELAKGSAMNMQGVTYKNFLVMIPLLVVPMALIGIFSLFDAKNIALIILAALGLAGIIFWKQLLEITEKQFLKRKYALCEGFRKKE